MTRGFGCILQPEEMQACRAYGPPTDLFSLGGSPGRLLHLWVTAVVGTGASVAGLGSTAYCLGPPGVGPEAPPATAGPRTRA